MFQIDLNGKRVKRCQTLDTSKKLLESKRDRSKKYLLVDFCSSSINEGIDNFKEFSGTKVEG
jgi:hypothetical protein